jgi:hypothetical protein
VFEGNAQTLDHVLVNARLLPRVTRFRYARNNADFPLAYATDYGRPERMSDHDMPVAYFSLSSADLIFRDGVASGDFSAWSSARTDGGDLSVAASAGMAGTALGIRAIMDDRAPLYVQDDSPENEPRYRARFYFDAAGFVPRTPLRASRLPIFGAFGGPTERLVGILLRVRDGRYAISAQVRQPGRLAARTPFIPITAGPHAVEFDWRRSSDAAAADGAFELWIDGVLVATLDGLRTGATGVNFARLGALNVKVPASGSLAWDEFESRRESYIGP